MLTQGLVLTLLGMTIVFAFLALLVLVLFSIYLIIKRFGIDVAEIKPEEGQSVKLQIDTTAEETTEAAIIAAITATFAYRKTSINEDTTYEETN
ncbi:MAG: sodium pump decarboxylase subunit gamma [Spirochaetes bacterium]|nr:MAG: sodium pump decarboxylase subunit gamma [Spirochaetota bacterium]